MSTVREILRSKSSEVWTTRPDVTVFDALVLMAEKNVGALVVVREGSVVGIISERDYARKVDIRGKSSRELRVQEIMTFDPLTVKHDQSLEECMQIMTERHIRHLPVLEDGKLVGMITIRDAIKSVITDKEHTITQLENYIKGR